MAAEPYISLTPSLVDTVILENGHQPDQQPIGDTPSSWQPIDLTTLPEEPPVRPTLGGLNVGIVYPGKRHLFTGPPESAKTLAAYAILIAVVRAGDTGILIDFEMGSYDARQRLRELGATTDEVKRIHYLEPDEQATDTHINGLVQLAPALVVIDAALGAFSLEGLDDSDRGDVEKLASVYIAPFRRSGTATIIIDHVVKDSEQRGRYAIGSERKLGVVDVALGFETIKAVSRGTSGLYKIVTNKDRGGHLKRGHLADLHLTSDPLTHTIAAEFTPAETAATAAADGFRFDIKMEQVSKHLEKLTEPISGNDLHKIVAGNRQAFFSALEDLITGGYARRIEGPKSPVEFVKAFTRDQVVPGGSIVVPEPANGTPVPGSPPSREEPVPEPFMEPLPNSGWFRDDGTFDASHLSHLESIAPDPEDTE